MKKVVVLVLAFGLIGSAISQIVYPTNVFWQFLEGLQAGDSTTQNYLQYKNGFLLLETDQRDEKVLQIRNELNNTGIVNLFIDDNGNGGISADSSNGNTVVKLRGALSDHSYINNEFVSVGRGGQSQDYGGTIDGAQFTVSSDTREPDYGLWDANNYQMMLQSAKDSLGGYAGLAFTSESAAQDRNVGAFINYRKTGNNGRGELHFGTKTSTTSLADGVHAMKIYDGSVTIDSTIILPNLYTGTSDTVLILDGDVVKQKDISSFADNIYNTDGTLTGDRTITGDGNTLTLDGDLDIDGKVDLNDGGNSVFIGEGAGSNDDATDNRNVGVGHYALINNTSGFRNVAIGYNAQYANTSANSNMAIGQESLRFNSTGSSNVAVGNRTLFNNTASSNTGIGGEALYSNTTGGSNVAIGYRAGRYLADGVTEATDVRNSLFLGANAYPLALGETNQIVIGYLATGIGSNTAVLGNDNIVTTALKGNVGIGTTAPSAQIHADNTATSGVGAIIENSDVTNTDDIIQFHNSTGEVASVTNEGYLNIKAATGTSDTVLIIDNDVVQKKALIIETGTYTPTITDSLNIDATTVNYARYNRTGNFVNVYININIDATSSNANTIIGVSLPIPSNFTLSTDAIGIGITRFDNSQHQTFGFVTPDTGGDKVYVSWGTINATNHPGWIEFTYEIK